MPAPPPPVPVFQASEASEEEVSPEVRQLMQLAEAGDAEGFVAHLEAHGIPVHARNDEGESALHLGCLYGHHPIVHLCLNRGADANAVDEDCSAPIHNACAGGFLEIVRELIGAGANLQAADSDGDTPLHHACNGNHADVARLLAQHGASPTATNRSGRAPPTLADDEAVRTACSEGVAEFAADPPPGARRVVKAKRTAKADGGASAPSTEMEGAPASAGTNAEPELPPEVLLQLLGDPEFGQALANPRVVLAMKEVLADPTRLESVCAQSPELTEFLSRVVGLGLGL
ncbi:ankyrin repeat-containing domain protein [Pavlovales sp. CCMP2436]|nr:ankyrin repeat-containing domain protein [Pavlovales sp. CCMP2436]